MKIGAGCDKARQDSEGEWVRSISVVVRVPQIRTHKSGLKYLGDQNAQAISQIAFAQLIKFNRARLLNQPDEQIVVGVIYADTGRSTIRRSDQKLRPGIIDL